MRVRVREWGHEKTRCCGYDGLSYEYCRRRRRRRLRGLTDVRKRNRLGWTTKYADLNYPVGFAEDSYGIRDVDGSKISLAHRRTYMKKGFGWSETEQSGDVIGCLIQLPDTKTIASSKISSGSSGTSSLKDGEEDPSKGGEEKDTKMLSSVDVVETCVPTSISDTVESSSTNVRLSSSTSETRSTSIDPRSEPSKESSTYGTVRFFVNGIDGGVAFDRVKCHRRKKYYPAVSLYMDAKVRWNFGPNFRYSPPSVNGEPIRPMCDAAVAAAETASSPVDAFEI